MGNTGKSLGGWETRVSHGVGGKHGYVTGWVGNTGKSLDGGETRVSHWVEVIGKEKKASRTRGRKITLTASYRKNIVHLFPTRWHRCTVQIVRGRWTGSAPRGSTSPYLKCGSHDILIRWPNDVHGACVLGNSIILFDYVT